MTGFDKLLDFLLLGKHLHSSVSYFEMDMEPVLYAGKQIQYGGQVVGNYAREASGDRVAVLWKVYHDYQKSYSTSVGLLNKIDDDVEYIYMYDKNTKELYKFKRSTYEREPVNPHDEDQKSPHVACNIGYWENGEEIVEGEYTVSVKWN